MEPFACGIDPRGGEPEMARADTFVRRRRLLVAAGSVVLLGGAWVVAGMLRNSPANLIRWIRDPQGVVPGNAMPDMGVTEADARDIAAYLYTLR